MCTSLPQMAPEEQVLELRAKVEEQRHQGARAIPIPWWVKADALTLLKKEYPGSKIDYVYNVTYLVFPERSQ